MSASVWNFVWRSAYHDSVTLMRLTRDLEAASGVSRAAAMMGTPQNRDVLRDAGLLTAVGESSGPTDLVIAIAAESEAAARAAEALARTALTAPPAETGGNLVRPRTLASALRRLPDASLALVSVPGPYAGAQARKALDAGLHVMLFSDNVPLETEIELKRLARSRGLFLMGPDCGTAIIAGVPLGFANAVPRGRIGIAAASGTGVQEVSTLIARAGEGISHAIGVGGRDLSAAVGGLMMEQALAVLAADAATEAICVIGKPAEGDVAARLTRQLAGLGKPSVVHFVGATADRSDGGASVSAATLEGCARAAVALVRGVRPELAEFTLPREDVERLVAQTVAELGPGQRFVRGVFSGGTLAWEARSILHARVADVAPGVTGGGHGHRVVDLGEDVFTAGRPHPMIDGTLRREWIAREASDSGTAVVLLDLVLGYGAHPDPAGELLPVLSQIRGARGRRVAIVASVTGTDADPQPRAAQVAGLRGAGVVVMPSNAQAARLAAAIAVRANPSA